MSTKFHGVNLPTFYVATLLLYVVAVTLGFLFTLSSPTHLFYETLFLLTLNGLLFGGIYALVSGGLTIIYGTMDIANFAHGSFLMLSMYVSYWLFTLFGLDPFYSLFIVAPLFLAIGWILEKTLIERVLEAPLVSQFLITFALMVFIQNVAIASWSVDPRTIRTNYSFQLIHFLDVNLLLAHVMTIMMVFVISIVGYLFLNRTWWGLALRSTAQNRDASAIVGVNTHTVYALAFALGIGLVSVAGVLLSTFYPMTPIVGEAFLLAAFLVVVMGGLGNYMGALYAGLTIGVVENIFAFVIGPQFKQLSYLVLFIIILILKPQGLFSR